jgi:hypothetical protein
MGIHSEAQLNRRFIRKYSLHKFRRAVMRGDTPVVNSLLGHAK